MIHKINKALNKAKELYPRCLIVEREFDNYSIQHDTKGELYVVGHVHYPYEGDYLKFLCKLDELL